MHPSTFRADRPAAPLPSRIETRNDLARWQGEHAEAEAALRRLQSERVRMFASATIEAITRKDAEIAAARLRVERAAAVIEAAERKTAEAEAREAAKEPERRRKHAAGRKAATEAERIMRQEYGPAATKLAGILSRLAELRTVIDGANADLPDGADRLDPDAFRGLPATPSRYEMRPVVVMVDEDGVQVQGTIRTEGDRDRGNAPDDGGPAIEVSGHGNPGSRNPVLRRETRERRVYVEGSQGIAMPPLTGKVALPGLAWDDAPFWPPAAH